MQKLLRPWYYSLATSSSSSSSSLLSSPLLFFLFLFLLHFVACNIGPEACSEVADRVHSFHPDTTLSCPRFTYPFLRLFPFIFLRLPAPVFVDIKQAGDESITSCLLYYYRYP